MNRDLRAMLERQAAWQKSRADQPWAEKLRAAVAMRKGIEALRKSTPKSRDTDAKIEP